MEFGERTAATLAREIREELGAEIREARGRGPATGAQVSVAEGR